MSSFSPSSSSSSYNVEDNSQFKFLLKVVDDRLELQHQVLKDLEAKYKQDNIDNNPLVAFISVVGQPKSRKTYLINALKDFLAQSAGAGACHLTRNNLPSKPYSICEQERLGLGCDNGILIWNQPVIIQGDEDKRFVILFLDIWSEWASSAIYTKLVKFCSVVSSILVINDASSNSPHTAPLWNVTKSFLDGKEELKQLQIKIQKKHNTIYYKLSILGNHLQKGNTLESLKLDGIIEVIDFLGHTFFETNLKNQLTYDFKLIQESTLISGKYVFPQEQPQPRDNPQLQPEIVPKRIYNLLHKISREKPHTISSLKDSLEEVVDVLNNPQVTDTPTTPTEQLLEKTKIPESEEELKKSSKISEAEKSQSQHPSLEFGVKDVKEAENTDTETATDPESESSNKNGKEIKSQPQRVIKYKRSKVNTKTVDADGETKDHYNGPIDAVVEADGSENSPANTMLGSQVIPFPFPKNEELHRSAADQAQKLQQDTYNEGQTNKILYSNNFPFVPNPHGVSEVCEVSASTAADAASKSIPESYFEKPAENSESLPFDYPHHMNVDTLPAAESSKTLRSSYTYDNLNVDTKYSDWDQGVEQNENEGSKKYTQETGFPERNKKDTSKIQIITSSVHTNFFTSIAPHFQEISQEFRSCTELKKNEIITKLHERLQADPLNFNAYFSNSDFSQYINKLKNESQSHEIQWLKDQSSIFEDDLNLLQKILEKYVEQLRKSLQELIVFGLRQAVDIDPIRKTVKDAIDSVKNTTWKHNKYMEMAEKTVKRIAETSYSTMINEEEILLVEETVCFAEKTYKNFVHPKMVLPIIYTNKQVKTLHQIAVNSIFQSFNPKQLNPAYVWEDYCQTMRDRLEPFQQVYLKLNLDKLKAEQSLKKLVSKCEKIYTDTMMEQTGSFVHQVPLHEMNKFHSKAKEETMQVWNESEFMTPNLELELNEKLTKLQLHFNEENERKPAAAKKDNNLSAVQDISSRPFEEPNNTANTPCGIGIYFGPDNVQLRVHKDQDDIINDTVLDRYPKISFSSGFPMFAEKGEKGNSFNIYKLLLPSTPYERKKVKALSNSLTPSLLPEEIVAIFLNKIKSEAELKTKVEIKSCVVATSAFMNTVARRRLKSALFIAGFKNSTLIQSTTDLGLSYVVQNHLYLKTLYTMQPIILVHHYKSTFDIALAKVKSNFVTIKRIEEDHPKWDKVPAVQNSRIKLIENAIRECKSKHRQLDFLIIEVDGNKEIRKAIEEYISKKSSSPKLFVFEKENKTSLGAAFLHASQNSNSLLHYEEVFPHTLLLKIDGFMLPTTIVDCNTPISSGCMQKSLFILFPGTIDSKKMIIEEKETGCKTQYNIQGNLIFNEKYQVIFNLDFEGWIASVEIASTNTTEPLKVQSTEEFMNDPELNKSLKKLEHILLPSTSTTFDADEEEERQNPMSIQACSNSYSNSSTATATQTVSSNQAEKEEIIVKLKHLIEVTKTRLDKTTRTSTVSINRCRERIRTSEEAVENPDVKANALLRIIYSQLEVCASTIIDD